MIVPMAAYIQDELRVIKYCSKLHQLRQKYSEILYDIAAFYDKCVLACEFIYETPLNYCDIDMYKYFGHLSIN